MTENLLKCSIVLSATFVSTLALYGIDSGIHVCDVFPDGIPDEICQGDNNHTKPYPGDNGIHFE
jgi:hypothetical protein